MIKDTHGSRQNFRRPEWPSCRLDIWRRLMSTIRFEQIRESQEIRHTVSDVPLPRNSQRSAPPDPILHLPCKERRWLDLSVISPCEIYQVWHAQPAFRGVAYGIAKRHSTCIHSRQLLHPTQCHATLASRVGSVVCVTIKTSPASPARKNTFHGVCKSSVNVRIPIVPR